MTLDDVRDAIETRVAGWTDAPVAWDNLPPLPEVAAAKAAGDPWVEVQILDGDGVTQNLADDVRRTGLVFAKVFTALDSGSAQARVLATSLAAHLEHYRAGNLKLRQANAQRVGPDNGWYQYNLRIPFIAL